jgi:hypothetical protein
MGDALSVLQRIRQHRKKGAESAFMEADRARDAQEAVVLDMEEKITQSRNSDTDDDEACWVAQAAAWRLKMEMRLRTEKGRLLEREGTSNERQRELSHASREHRVVERIIEINNERRKVDERRKEGRKLDAMGTSRWHRKGIV